MNRPMPVLSMTLTADKSKMMIRLPWRINSSTSGTIGSPSGPIINFPANATTTLPGAISFWLISSGINAPVYAAGGGPRQYGSEGRGQDSESHVAAAAQRYILTFSTPDSSDPKRSPRQEVP